MLSAVITGDIIGSSMLDETIRSYTIEQWLQNALPTHSLEFSRGDSFQLAVAPSEALTVSLMIRAYLRAQKTEKKYRPDSRISIGLGTITLRNAKLSTSSGSAFEYSGRELDRLKEQLGQLRISSDYTELNLALNVCFTLLEWLVAHWTTAQAQAVYYSLLGYTQQHIAEIDRVSQPAVQQRLQAAGWPAVDNTLNYYRSLINKLETT